MKAAVKLISLIFLLSLFSCKSYLNLNNQDNSKLLELKRTESKDLQTTSVKITVRELINRNPMPFTSVNLLKDKKEIEFVANDGGIVLIDNLEEGVYKLAVSFVGFDKLIIKRLNIIKGEDLELVVGLREKTEVFYPVM